MGLGCQPCEAFGPVAPAAPIDGALWVDSSTGPPYQLKRWNAGAAAWEDVGGAGGGSGIPGFPVGITVPPTGVSWAWVNQAAATATDTGQGLVLHSPGNGGVITALVLPLPPAGVRAAWAMNSDLAAPVGAGLLLRESSSGKLELHGWGLSAHAGVHEYWNSPTSFNSSPAGVLTTENLRQALGLTWVAVGDDGTSRYCDVSADGANWLRLYGTARTSFLTADQAGIWVRGGGAVDITLVSWG